MPTHSSSLDSHSVSTTTSIPNFVTDHLALAAFLVSRGYDPTLASSRSGKVLFSFSATSALNAAIASYNDGNAQVEPTAYDAARIQLRKQMDALKGAAR